MLIKLEKVTVPNTIGGDDNELLKGVSFADDMNSFVAGNRAHLVNTKSILSDFLDFSDLEVNFKKSFVMPIQPGSYQSTYFQLDIQQICVFCLLQLITSASISLSK